MVRYTDWRTMTCRIGWQNLVDLSGLSRATVRRVIRRLRDWGFLGVVETGSTRRTRGCHEGDTDGNRGAEYVLCVPGHEAVEISDPPSLGSRREPVKPHVRARETAQEADDRPWPMHQPPATRGQRLAATRRLQQQAPVLARLSDRQLRSVLRPWFVAGWTPAQVLYALDHTPDGQARWHTADVRHVPGWIRSRLAAWDGQTPPRQLGAGRKYDLTPDQVAELRNAPRLADDKARTHATAARQKLDAVLRRIKTTAKPRQGLGIAHVTEDPAAVTASRYAADDPRARYAEMANQDAAADIRAAAKRTRRERMPSRSGDGFDWLRRGLERRQQTAGPGRAIA